MEFMQNAGSFLISIGYTQGFTKTTENNYQKGFIEIVLFKTNFIRRRIFQGRVFSQHSFDNATLRRLKIVTMKQTKSNVSFKKDKK